MKIDISDKQFETLLNALGVSTFIYGTLSDMVSKKYKKQNTEINDTFDFLSSFASGFGFKKETRMILNDRTMAEEGVWDDYLSDLSEYDEYVFWEGLAEKFSKRDFLRTITKEENLFIKNNGGFPERLCDLDSMWWEEIDKYGVDRLEIKKS